MAFDQNTLPKPAKKSVGFFGLFDRFPSYPEVGEYLLWTNWKQFGLTMFPPRQVPCPFTVVMALFHLHRQALYFSRNF